MVEVEREVDAAGVVMVVEGAGSVGSVVDAGAIVVGFSGLI